MPARAPIRAKRDTCDFTRVALQDPWLAAACDVPEPERAVFATRCHPLPIRAEGDGEDQSAMASQGLDFPAACRVPHPDRLIVACRGQLLAIRAVCQAENPVRVSFQVPYVLAGDQVPDLDGPSWPAEASRWPSGLNTTLCTGRVCPFKRQRLRAARRVPYPDRLIKTRRCHAISIRTERHAGDESTVSSQSGKGALVDLRQKYHSKPRRSSLPYSDLC